MKLYNVLYLALIVLLFTCACGGNGNATDKIDKTVKDNNLTYAMVIDNKNISSNYNVKSIPTTFVLDKQGIIRATRIGYSDELEAEYEILIKALLNDEEVGQNLGKAKDFTLPTYDKIGNISLSDYKGKVVMVNFWATWCPPCRKELPMLQRLYTKYNTTGFELIGISLD